MSPGASAKRPAAEEFVRNFDSQRNANSANKKPRFDPRNPSTLAQAEDDPDADQDAILELDEIGKGGQQEKRNAVRLEGYESDSSNEGFDARAEEKARAQKAADKMSKSKAKDDEDMFADLEDDFRSGGEDEDVESGGKKRKEVHFMDSKDIQGQVASSKAGGHVSADFGIKSGRGSRALQDESDDSESDADDEERDRIYGVDEELGAGAKKSKAPKLDAFNMKSEAEEGRFDGDGTYVRNATDPNAKHDAWLDGTTKKDIRKAREAHEKLERERRQREVERDAVSKSEILAKLIKRLDVGETPLEAIARHGRQDKKAKPEPKWKQKRRAQKSGMDLAATEQPKVDVEAEKRKEAVESITEAVSQLEDKGETNVYDTEREMFMREYKRETGEDWVEEQAAVGHEDGTATGETAKRWEYRFSDGRDDGQAYGPYDNDMMASWAAHGHFGEGMQFRLAGTEAWRDTVPEF